jgi:ribosomal protein S18 acetylase RimI-like enzyme
MHVRNAEHTELDALARIGYDGWHESHASIVPAALTRLRTRGNFRSRLEAAIRDVRVVGPSGEPAGFCLVKGDEVYQLFVSAQSRGSGAAAALIGDAEARLFKSGVDRAWLACAIGNERAARFYEKSGWQRAGTMMNHVETSEGTFALEVWRYEKSLARRS